MLLQSLLLAAAGLRSVSAVELDTTSPDSIRNATLALAYNLLSYYKNNATGTSEVDIGTLPSPYYWWEAGAQWGAMVDYWAYTGDDSYNPTITQALLAQTGDDYNYMPTAYDGQLGNDDQSFWAFAVLSAAEYGFPNPPSGTPSWLSLGEAVFNTMVPRWNTTQCGGGLKWQIFPANNGYDYKNSAANAGFFQIAARLARYTGNETYSHWANTIWDWSTEIGLIDDAYNVYDGSDDTINCTQIDHDLYSYNGANYLHGAAMMYNYTNASSIWATRTTGLLEALNATYFQAESNSSNILVEVICEPTDSCNNDQYSFKGYVGRWLAKTSVVAPFTAPAIRTLLDASATAAAQSCSAGTDNVTCGERWYVGGYDGKSGLGQEMSALEVIQALLIDEAPALQRFSNVSIIAAPTSTLIPPTATATAVGVSGRSDDASLAAHSRVFGARHGKRSLSAAAALLGVTLGHR